MARRPDTPCSRCGKLLWSGTTSRPAAQRVCRGCSTRSTRDCEVCAAAFVPTKPSIKTCSVRCGVARRRARGGYAWSAEPSQCAMRGCELIVPTKWCDPHRLDVRNSHWRNKNHQRRRAEVATDITAEYERAMRARAKRCPLCLVKLTDVAGRPSSKELDHIIPINVFGTHTIGNVRIICRACNLARPKDGSDYSGPVTLWSQVPGFLPAVVAARSPSECAHCGSPLRARRCWTCNPSLHRGSRDMQGNHLTPEQRHHRGVCAASMRAEGRKWQDIADHLGFGSSGSAYLAAEKYGGHVKVKARVA